MVVLTSFSMPDIPIKYEQRNTRAVMDKKDLGLGTLYITERSLCWKEQGEIGFCLAHTHITLHAISTDPNVYPRECIYIMIDAHVTVPGVKEENISKDQSEKDPQDESDSEAESEPDISELILVPGDPSALKPMYEALKECQALNPDEECMDEDGEDDVYEDADEEIQGEDDRHYGDSEMGDIGAGGDTEIDNLANRLQNNGVNICHANGDHSNDEQFEDAD